jgi:hypothetical protein
MAALFRHLNHFYAIPCCTPYVGIQFHYSCLFPSNSLKKFTIRLNHTFLHFNQPNPHQTMNNPYQAPSSNLSSSSADGNNSGQGSGTIPPIGVKGWSWGAFFLNWIWAIPNKTWIGLLCLVPYIGFIFAFYIGFKGRELAWRNKRWDSLEHFQRVQKKWSVWGVVLVVGVMGIGILAAIALPAYQQYVQLSR